MYLAILADELDRYVAYVEFSCKYDWFGNVPEDSCLVYLFGSR